MKLRFKVPVNFYISGPTKESIESRNLKTTFQHDNFYVTMNMEDKAQLFFEDYPEDMRHIKQVGDLVFEIEEREEGTSSIEELVKKTEDYSELIHFLTPVVNRVFRRIRNSGFAPDVNEIYTEDEDVKGFVFKWNVEFSENGKTWREISPEVSDSDLFRAKSRGILGLSQGASTEIRISIWSDIAEAIQDNLEVPPEQEFLTNTFEHLRKRNFRLAVLESIIGLEIVLDQFLRRYLSIVKKITNKKIKGFLSPQLGLTNRVSVVLNLCIEKSDEPSKIPIEDVLEVIGWRNDVVHETGRLPAGLSKEAIIKKISSVIALANFLALRRDQITASPEIQRIEQNLFKKYEKYKVLPPRIWTMEKHRIVIEFVFISLPLPSIEVLESVVKDAASLLSNRDSRFYPKQHLYIRFKTFQETKAIWNKGKLEMLEEKT